jgi:hypothetical protein
MKNITFLLLTAFLLSVLSSCKERATTQNEQTPLVSVKTTPVIQGSIENNVIFNGKTIYLKKNPVVSPIAGYIVSTNVKFGDEVQRNDLLFEIQTKENKALENSGTSAGSIGIIKVLASSGGFINELNINETGGYVVEGGLLCNIVVNKDLMVQVNVPFEYNSLLKIGRKCKILLSDNTTIEGAIYQILPIIDEANQTQTILIKPDTSRQLPENLNLTIQFVYEKHSDSFLVARDAVMTNETQSEFWVMKIAGNNLAVKIPILKGIENDSIVEVLSSGLIINDLVISEGAYGLPDSTVVRIEK